MSAPRRQVAGDDGRKIGVVVHHVAFMNPLEIQVAQALTGGNPVTDLTGDKVDEISAGHAAENDGVTKQAALDLLLRNSGAAAAAVRALRDEQLSQAAPVSLYSDAPLTCQFHRGPCTAAQLSPLRGNSSRAEDVARAVHLAAARSK